MQLIEADYVVVGAGSAGCVVAGRLAERGDVSVLLLEAGRKERIPLSRMPAAVVKTLGDPFYDWNFKTEPDPSRLDRQEVWPRGKGPGGSSMLNGMVFVRGAASDFDAWEALGATGWGWADVLPAFRRLEASRIQDNEMRGQLGPLPVAGLAQVHPLTPAFLKACAKVGIEANADLNGRSQTGAGLVQANIDNGLRVSAFDAFVKLLLGPRLRLLDDALVERILFQGRRATGVLVRRGGETVQVQARLGVVLSAGTINSPQLLMLSGVGPGADLQRCGVDPLLVRPEVGRNLMEHAAVYARFEVDQPTGNSQARPMQAAVHLARWALLRTGPVANPTVQALAFFRSSPHQDSPDLQCQLLPFAAGARNGRSWLEPRPLMSMSINVSHPRSRGELRLRSADPASPMAIHPRLLEDDEDLAKLTAGVRWMGRLLAQPALADHIVGRPDLPSHDADESALVDHVRRTATPVFHPVGTCRMGRDREAVVTPDLQVQGLERLWVADASVFPRHISGNTNATALMIGEKAAELIGRSG